MMLKYSTMVIQNGPVREVGENGDQIDEVIEFVLEKLREFNTPPHNSRETSLAITDIESARNWLLQRTRDRLARNVEGTSNG